MSMHEFTESDYEKSLTKEQSVNLLLASIAYEELALSKLINSEAEKIKHVLSMSKYHEKKDFPCIDDILNVNNSVQQTLKNIIKTEIILQFKMEEALKILQADSLSCTCFTAPCC